MLALRPQPPVSAQQTQILVLLYLPLSRIMLFILAFLFLARRYGTSAVPIESSFAEPLAYDAPIVTRDECPACGCPGRTVWDIVWSCLATTFAVTWVSVHPNVPNLEEESWPLLKRRIFLMLLALLAPEVMIMWAFKQWRGALAIREAINKASPNIGVRWTMTHAHFLQMGGFKVNWTEGEAYFWRDWMKLYRYETKKEGIVVQECVLHLAYFCHVLEKQLIDFPDTTAKEIEDRSKGDALSKGVALLQITWFIIQLIARARQHLTITEIELTTAALAGLNSIMYLFWWSKPLDVRCPIIIETKGLKRQRKGRSGDNFQFQDLYTFRLRDYLRDSAQSIIRSLARASRRLIPRRSGNIVEPEIELQSLTVVRESSSVTRSHFRGAISWIWTTCTYVVAGLFYLPYLLMYLPMDRILNHYTLRFDWKDYSDAKVKIHNKPALHLLFDEDDMKWIMSMMFYTEYAEAMPLLIFSALAGAAFGSIHCAAWHFIFPSPVEQILWRTASLSIVGLCLFIIAISPVYTRLVYNKWSKYAYGTPEGIYWTRIKKTLETPPAIIYSVVRLSLLILALLSLRRLPPSAFDTVAWTKFIPHI